MNRRLTSFLLLAMTLGAFSHPARANGIREPQDSFYESHAQSCEYHARSYLANGDNGYAVIYDQPNGAAVTTLPNGIQIYVSFTYEDMGTLWGVVEFSLDVNGDLMPIYASETAQTGWVKLEEMKLLYDYSSFEEDYGSQFYPYTGSYDSIVGQQLFLYTYPNSGQQSDYGITPDGDLTFAHAYTDDAGREWGFIREYRGTRNCWVCITDPRASDLNSMAADRTVTPAAQAPEDLTAAQPENTASVVLVLAGAVVLITALSILRRKRKHHHDTDR